MKAVVAPLVAGLANGSVGRAPHPMCWCYTDASRAQGFWGACLSKPHSGIGCVLSAEQR
jgi:hypothetical protein